MKKFPVISKEGNEYEVEIFYGLSLAYAGMNIIISEVKGKTIFGRSRRKLEHYHILENEVNILEENSYIDLAKRYVERCEKENQRFIEHASRKKRYEEEFKEWDGRC